MKYLLVLYVLSIVLLIIGYSIENKEVKRVINRVAYSLNLFTSIILVAESLRVQRNQASQASFTTLIGTMLCLATGIVLALNIAHREEKKQIILGTSLTVAIVGIFLSANMTLSTSRMVGAFGTYGAMM